MVRKSALRRSVPVGELSEFEPVPRRLPRHDGWTPERQRYFVAALADTGCVAIAARIVNMSQSSVYQLRRQPGAEGFRAAMDAAQTLGLQPVRDEAFHRAMHGQLVPVFVGGKLMGFRRKKNDRLLMFILRHYGQDAQGRKTTINYFSTRAAAAANPPRNGDEQARHAPGRAADVWETSAPAHDRAQHGGGGPSAHVVAADASTTTVKTVITGPGASADLLAADTDAANLLNSFEGVELDAEARAEIYRALEAAAERRRALAADPAEDPERLFVSEREVLGGYAGELESGVEGDWVEYRPEGEHRWEGLGEGGEAAEIDEVLRGIEERRRLPAPDPDRSSPALAGQGDPPQPEPKAGGGASPSTAHPEPVPAESGKGRIHRPRTPYRKRRPKPPFTPPEPAQAEAWEARKAAATAEVEAERREAALAEAQRRKARARRG